MKFRLQVEVRLRQSVYDPQGEAIRRAISHRESRVTSVRQGKLFELEVEAETEEEARKLVEGIAKSVLANPVLEDASVGEDT